MVIHKLCCVSTSRALGELADLPTHEPAVATALLDSTSTDVNDHTVRFDDWLATLDTVSIFLGIWHTFIIAGYILGINGITVDKHRPDSFIWWILPLFPLPPEHFSTGKWGVELG